MQTDVAIARIEEQMRGFIEVRQVRDQHVDSMFSGLSGQLQEISADLAEHSRIAASSAAAQSHASMVHEMSDTSRFARLEWVASLGENYKKIAVVFFAGVVVAVLLGSHGPDLVVAIIKMFKGG